MTPDWDTFVAECWGAAVRALQVGPVFDAGEVLRAVEDALWGSPARYAPMARVYVDGRRVPVPLGPAIDQAPPGSTAELLDRVRAAAGQAGEATVVVNDLQIGSPASLTAGQAFIAPLIERVGLPTDRLGIDVFAGDYSELPFGRHVDPSDNFLFAVEGLRRIEAGDERHDLRPGGALYWPAETVHVGACPDGPSLAVTLSWWSQAGPVDEVLHALVPAWRQALRSDDPRAISYGIAPGDDLPPALARAARALVAAASDPTLAERALREHWLAKRAAMGFHPLPRRL